jgi:protease-4
MIDVAASGGYYAAMGADEISALPTTITGSIGVIASFPLVQKLAESVGYEQRTFVTGANKDLGSLFKEFTPAQRELVQATIDEMFERFLDVVSAGRPKLPRERVRQLADGRVYTGPQAKKLGLVDHVEYVPDLIARVEKDLGSSVEIVTYGYSLASGSSLYRAGGPAEGFRADAGAPGVSIPSEVKLSLGVKGFEPLPAGFYYLWQAP